MSVRFILIVATIQGLETQVIYFVHVFSQAKLDTGVFVEMPQGMVLSGVPKKEQWSKYVLELNSSLYGLKQTSAKWCNMLFKGLKI